MSKDYYSTCPFPKPGTAKKRKQQNGYRDKPSRICWYCGRDHAERHEIFGGPYRELSIEKGFQVDVCQQHHRRLHSPGDDWGETEAQKWRMFFQWKWENEQIAGGVDPEEAREGWIILMGRNYL